MKQLLTSAIGVSLSLLMLGVAHGADISKSSHEDIKLANDATIVAVITRLSNSMLIIEEGQFTCKAGEHRMIFVSFDLKLGLLGCAKVDFNAHTIDGELEGHIPIHLVPAKEKPQGSGPKITS